MWKSNIALEFCNKSEIISYQKSFAEHNFVNGNEIHRNNFEIFRYKMGYVGDNWLIYFENTNKSLGNNLK